MPAEHLDWIPKRGIVSIVGDFIFPLGSYNVTPRLQRQAYSRIISTIAYVNPRLIYGMPSEGVNLNVLNGLSVIDEVKCILVNPYPGYFEYVTNDAKNTLLELVESSQQTITIHKEPAPLSKRDEALDEALKYMAEISDAIFLIYDGTNNTERFDLLWEKLSDYEDIIILCDYGG